MTGSSRRDGFPDLLKGLAVLWMIQVHLTEQLASPALFNSSVGDLSLFLGGPACAPVFLLVMGYFLLAKERSPGYYIRRGVVLITGGLLLNVARSANLLVHIAFFSWQTDPWPFIFGADILPLAGLSVIIAGLLKPIAYRFHGSILLVLAILVAWATPLLWPLKPGNYMFQLVFAFLAGPSPWSFFPLFPWFAYVLAGMWLRSLLTQKPVLSTLVSDSRSLLLIVPAMAVLTVTLPWASGITRNLEGINSYYHHGLPFFEWVMTFILVYGFLIRQLAYSYGERKLVRWIRWVGENVTLVYVVQWAIIGNLATILFRSVEIFAYLIWLIAILAMTILISAAFLRFRAARFPRIYPSLTLFRFRKKR